MGKHGVLVWDRIFEGGRQKARSSWQGLGMLGQVLVEVGLVGWAGKDGASGEGKKAAGN